MRKNNLSECEIYHIVKEKYGQYFYDCAFTLNNLFGIDYNSDDDNTETSMTSGTTTE